MPNCRWPSCALIVAVVQCVLGTFICPTVTCTFTPDPEYIAYFQAPKLLVTVGQRPFALFECVLEEYHYARGEALQAWRCPDKETLNHAN